MKKYIFVGILLLGLMACEKVIDLELNSEQPRLVIEANLFFNKSYGTLSQQIQLSLSSSYFENNFIPARGAEVYVLDSNAKKYSFLEAENGIYYPMELLDFSYGARYTLSITYEGEVYEGSEVFLPVNYFSRIEQKNYTLFGNEVVELKAYSKDEDPKTNYSLFEFLGEDWKIPDYTLYRDDFIESDEFYGIHISDDIEAGDEIRIRLFSISERFYQYMTLLIQQSFNQGGPFQAQVANLTGNCVNLTRPEHYPLGYFRISEVAEVFYTVE
ncbi:DUF4249 domain-containing protein [Flavobacteriaceae bacterium]|jgi:hypothetical protein|nr:DUF4249 domain-containing protein [Flavobacteriaceae bacterium]MDA7711989.1 DUF4249 domain-containing protein [Flavobacteriaceae bacterium]MDB4306955.1 DUF4249 domain-containing protein [Flavobacteriaceae bacterium]